MGDDPPEKPKRQTRADLHDPNRGHFQPPERTGHPHEAHQNPLPHPGFGLHQKNLLDESRNAAMEQHSLNLFRLDSLIFFLQNLLMS